MKYLLLLSLVTTLAHAQMVSRQQFLKLSDEAKMEFLNKHAEEKELTSRQRSSALVKQLEAAALREANVWGDTILEGPYAQTGDAKIEFAHAYIVNKEIYAYRFMITADAIFTEGDGCEYNDETENWSEACYESAGHISEDVSFSFNGEEFDEGSYAEFND